MKLFVKKYSVRYTLSLCRHPMKFWKYFILSDSQRFEDAKHIRHRFFYSIVYEPYNGFQIFQNLFREITESTLQLHSNNGSS